MTALEQSEALPIRDTDPLHRRIAALDAEQQERLRDLWQCNGLGAIDPLVTTETYKHMERLVANVEVSVTGPEVWRRLAELNGHVAVLPDNIADACAEALEVYAGMPRNEVLTEQLVRTISTTGRLAEVERIVCEAVAYAAEIAAAKEQHPSSLPPIDEPTQAEVAATFTDYPGPKAKADEVLAWVGGDRNRAARAFLHELHDRTPRKGVTGKLTELLGVDGVAAVDKALADSEPPPLDLSSPPLPPGGDENAEEGATSAPGAGASEEAPSSSGDESVEPPVLDEEPPAPEELTRRLRLVEATRNLGLAYIELAVALEEVG